MCAQVCHYMHTYTDISLLVWLLRAPAAADGLFLHCKELRKAWVLGGYALLFEHTCITA